MTWLYAFVFLVVGTVLITYALGRLMLASECRKAEAQRHMFNRIMQASQPPSAAGLHRDRKRVS